MTYVEQVCTALIDTLERTSTLAEPDFAGHAANLEFWRGEVLHACDLIDGYDERFDRMCEARSRRGLGLNPLVGSGPPLHKGLKSSRRKELRCRLTELLRRFEERAVAK